MASDAGGRAVRARVLITGMAILLVACPPPGPCPTVASSPRSNPVDRIVNAPVLRGSGRVSVQLMVDQSGSMGGFGPVLPHIEAWIWRGITRTASYGFDIDSQRNCGFSGSMGVQCEAPGFAPRAFRGNTNLDEAVAAAPERDLSVIVTDGVAATGETPGASCATGVDAACIGNRLADVVRRPGGRGGIWLIPLTARFRGDLYTERRVPATAFNPVAVENAGAGDVVVADPRNLSTGELVYRYEGPRALLVIVVARDANLGRAFIAGLGEARETESVPGLASVREGMELYPGAVTTFEWTAARVARDWPNVAKSLRIERASQTARFANAAAGQCAGSWEISAVAREKPVARTKLLMLPLAESTIDVRGNDVKAGEFRHSPDALTSKIVIGENFTESDCANASLRLSATRRGDLLDETTQYSTETPEIQPSRVFGLKAIIKAFYDRVGPMADLPIAELRLCAGN